MRTGSSRVLHLLLAFYVLASVLAKKSLRLHDLVAPLIIAGVFFALAHFGVGKWLQQWIDPTQTGLALEVSELAHSL